MMIMFMIVLGNVSGEFIEMIRDVGAMRFAVYSLSTPQISRDYRSRQLYEISLVKRIQARSYHCMKLLLCRPIVYNTESERLTSNVSLTCGSI